MSRVNWILSILLVLMLPVDAFSEEPGEATEKVVKIEDITVTGDSKEADVKDVGVVKTINQEDLEKIQLIDTSDTLKYVPSVVVTSRQPGASSRVTIRGLGASGRSITVADGMTLTDFTGSYCNVRWSQIMPEEVESVEVVYGPFSALYPGNAVGGAVAITTREPEKREMSMTAGYGFQEYSVYKFSEILPYSKLNLTYGDRVGKLHMFAALSRFEVAYQPYSYSTKTVDSTSSGTGQAVTGWTSDTDPLTGETRYIFGDQGQREELQYLGKLRLGLDLNAFTSISAEYRHWTDEQERNDMETYLRDSEGNPVWSGRVEVNGRTYNPTYYKPVESASAGNVFQIAFKREPEEGLVTRLVAAFVNNFMNETESATGTMPDAMVGGEGELSKSSSGWYNVDWRNSMVFAERHEVTGGLHYDQQFLEGDSWELSNWTNKETITGYADGSEGKTKCYALFLQDDWTISDKFSLYLGGRYEWWRGYDGTISGLDSAGNKVTQSLEDRDENYFSPKAAFTYRPYEQWRLRLSLAQAYRFPTVAELFYGSIDPSTGYTTRTNPDLKTEKTFAKDISIIRDLDDGSMRLSLFENDMEDYILRQTNINTQVNYYQNIESVRIRGVELDLSKRINRYFKPGLNVTFLEPKILENSGYPDSEGKIVPGVAEWMGNLTLEFTPTEKISAVLGANYQSTAYTELDNSDVQGSGYGGYNGALIVDLKLSYRFNQNWYLALAVDNITNEEAFWFHPYNQRMYSVELKWNL